MNVFERFQKYLDIFGHVWTQLAVFGWVRRCSHTFGYIPIESFSIQVPANIDLAETTFGRNYPEAPLAQFVLSDLFNNFCDGRRAAVAFGRRCGSFRWQFGWGPCHGCGQKLKIRAGLGAWTDAGVELELASVSNSIWRPVSNSI